MLSYTDHAKFDYFMLSFSQGQLQNEQSSNFFAIALLIHPDHSFNHIFVSDTLTRFAQGPRYCGYQVCFFI